MASVELIPLKNLQHKQEDVNKNMDEEERNRIINENSKNTRIQFQIIQDNIKALNTNLELINGEL